MQILYWLEPLWLFNVLMVLLFPARLLNDESWYPVALLALFAFWPLNYLAERRLLPPAPLHLALALMLLWLPVNLWAAVDLARAWGAAAYLLIGVAFYGACLRWPLFRRQPVILAWLLAIFAAALALIGPFIVVQDNAWPLIGPLQQRAAPFASRLGETINPNILAGGLVVVLPLVMSMLIAPADPDVPTRGWTAVLQRVALLGIAVLLLIVIALSGSRGAQMAAAAALSVVFCLRWPRLLWALPVLALVVAGAIVWLGPETLLDQLSTGGSVGGLEERVEIWGRALYALQDFAFTGVGLGHFNQVIPLLYPYFLIPPSVDIPHAHNMILQIGVDLGFPGLIAWLAMMITVITHLITTLRHPSGISRMLAVGVIGAIVAMLVHGQLDAALWGTRLAFLPWVLFALAVLAADQRVTAPTPRPDHQSPSVAA